MKELYKRLITGIIGIILLSFIVVKGGIYLATSILILSLVGLREFYSALEKLGLDPINVIGYIGALGLFILNFTKLISIEFILALITMLLLILFIIEEKVEILDIGITLLGIFYVPFLLGHIFYLDRTIYIWLIFIIAFGTDTFAYIFGNLFGKRKLAPTISPNKTIEGSIGGILGSLIFSLIFSVIVNIPFKWRIALLSILASIIAQIGDLVASGIKRRVKIKDYGSIFPGHGGVLDRFDSMIFSAPLIYYFVQYFLI